jgi:probable addiction module antidote protein
MALKTTRYDTADYLDSPEAIAAYIDAVFEDGDPALLTHALGVVARARGMTQIARETGLSRESLYRALGSDGNPEFSTVVRVLKAMGLRLTAVPTGTPSPTS